MKREPDRWFCFLFCFPDELVTWGATSQRTSFAQSSSVYVSLRWRGNFRRKGEGEPIGTILMLGGDNLFG